MMSNPEHDDRLNQIYQQIPKEQVSAKVKEAIWVLAKKQAVINAEATKGVTNSSRLGWLKRLFQLVFIGVPVYGWVSMALCVLAVLVVMKPTSPSSTAQDTSQQMAVSTDTHPRIDQPAIDQQPIVNKLRVAPVESADSFRLPDESTQVAQVRQTPRIEIHGHVEPIPNEQPSMHMSSVSPSFENTTEAREIETALVKIRLLKTLGKSHEATRAIKDFQQQYPQQPIPHDLQKLIEGSHTAP